MIYLLSKEIWQHFLDTKGAKIKKKGRRKGRKRKGNDREKKKEGGENKRRKKLQGQEKKGEGAGKMGTRIK